MIWVRALCSNCSHWLVVAGCRSAQRVPVQIAQRPSWATRSRWVVGLIGRGVLRRRRARYSVRVGSSVEPAAEYARLCSPGHAALRHMGCLRADGREWLLERFSDNNVNSGNWVGPVLLAAPYAALVLDWNDEHYDTGQTGTVQVFDLRSGRLTKLGAKAVLVLICGEGAIPPQEPPALTAGGPMNGLRSPAFSAEMRRFKSDPSGVRLGSSGRFRTLRSAFGDRARRQTCGWRRTVWHRPRLVRRDPGATGASASRRWPPGG